MNKYLILSLAIFGCNHAASSISTGSGKEPPLLNFPVPSHAEDMGSKPTVPTPVTPEPTSADMSEVVPVSADLEPPTCADLAPACLPVTAPCTLDSECCSNDCDGDPTSSDPHRACRPAL